MKLNGPPPSVLKRFHVTRNQSLCGHNDDLGIIDAYNEEEAKDKATQSAFALDLDKTPGNFEQQFLQWAGPWYKSVLVAVEVTETTSSLS
jgi:hypothetical protein